jgi:hypothetical protein
MVFCIQIVSKLSLVGLVVCGIAPRVTWTSPRGEADIETDRVYDQLLKLIITLELEPGSQLKQWCHPAADVYPAALRE